MIMDLFEEVKKVKALRVQQKIATFGCDLKDWWMVICDNQLVSQSKLNNNCAYLGFWQCTQWPDNW